MIQLINGTTGTPMWVADNRVDEYLKRGHRLAPVPDSDKPEKPAKAVPVKKSMRKK